MGTCGIIMTALLLSGAGDAGTRHQYLPQAKAIPGARRMELHLPPGDVTAWIDEMTDGLREVPSLGREHAAARITELYIGRQEYLELLYADGGAVSGDGHRLLDAHIRSAESAFHELMTLTRTHDSRDGSIDEAVARAIGDLVAARREILALGLPLRPDSVARGGSGRSDSSTPAVTKRALARSPAIRDIIQDFERALVQYGRGDARTALKTVESAYLDRFEPLEPRLRGDLVSSIERVVHLSLRPGLQGGAPMDEMERVVSEARLLLLEADDALTRPMSRIAGFGQGFVIILREGMEAVLLLGVLLTGLTRLDGGGRLRRAVGWGVGAAVGLSVVTWFVLSRFVQSFGLQRELIEGAVTLLAALVLVLVCNWLFRRTYVDDWKSYLQERLARAAGTGSVLTVSALAFAVVFREGVETVLFYQALLFDADRGAVLVGLMTGVAAVSMLAVGLLRMGRKLPVRQLFVWTNVTLVLLAFVLVGKGIYSLSEAGIFTPTPIAGIHLPPMVPGILGIHPVAETLMGQLFLVLALIVTFVLARRQALTAGPIP